MTVRWIEGLELNERPANGIRASSEGRLEGRSDYCK